MSLKLACAECLKDLDAEFDRSIGRFRIWPCACQKPKPKKEYEPVFNNYDLAFKGIGGLPHD